MRLLFHAICAHFPDFVAEVNATSEGHAYSTMGKIGTDNKYYKTHSVCHNILLKNI